MVSKLMKGSEEDNIMHVHTVYVILQSRDLSFKYNI